MMRSRHTRTAVPLVMLLGVLVSTGSAFGALVASATSRFCLVVVAGPGAPVGSYLADPGSFAESKLTWDDVTTTPFGQPVNFGQQVGLSWFDGSSTLTSPTGGTFSHSEAASNPAIFSNSAAGDFLCIDDDGNDSTCNASSFVGTYTSHSGSVFAGLPADAVYTFDGAATWGGGYTSRNGHICQLWSGRVTINAFAPVATAESPPDCETTNSCAVEVSQVVEFQLPDGTTGAADVGITYPQVVTAGTTTVSALSQAPGDLPADLAIEVGGFRAAFFELATTAVYDTSSGPIEVCLPYDLGGAPFSASQLKFMHRENGVFVDRTSRLDEVNHRICGALTSFSPVVLALPVDCHYDFECDDGNPCSADDCVSGACQNVVDPQCVACTTDADCVDAVDLCTKDTCVNQVCQHALPTGCAEGDKAGLQFKQVADDAGKNSLSWKFSGAGLQYGFPTVTTKYTFCFLDGSNVLKAMEIPGGALCGGEPCWTKKGGNASYKDKTLSRNGIASIKVKKNTTKGTLAIALKAKGANLQTPAIPVPLPLTAVMWTSDPNAATDCWKTTVHGGPKKNEDGKFQW